MAARLAPNDQPHASRAALSSVIGGSGDDFISASVDLTKLKSKQARRPLGGPLGRVSPFCRGATAQDNPIKGMIL